MTEETTFWDPLKAGAVPKKVDEEWKRKAREEARRAAAGAAEKPTGSSGSAAPAGGAARPSAPFVEFLTEIAAQAAMHLQARHLEQARYTIEILEVLKEKTRGNLADEEQKILDRYIYELQMQYVQILKAAAGPRTQPEQA